MLQVSNPVLQASNPRTTSVPLVEAASWKLAVRKEKSSRTTSVPLVEKTLQAGSLQYGHNLLVEIENAANKMFAVRKRKEKGVFRT